MTLREQLIAYRRELHQHPELSMQEVETTVRLKRWLTEQGIKVLPLRVGLVNAFQTIVSRRMSSLHNVVVSVTKFQAGNTWNVIPNQALLEGAVRTFQQEVRAEVPKLMQAMCEGVALATGSPIEFIWHAGLAPVVNNAELAQVAREACEAAGLKVVEAKQNLAGEDFAHYLEQLPGCFVWLGDNGPYQWHQSQYIIDEGVLTVGAEYLAQLAETVLQKWEKLSFAKQKE